MKVLVDTNIFVFAYVDKTSEATQIRSLLMNKSRFSLIYTEQLKNQIRRVLRRLVSKDDTGLILNRIERDFQLAWLAVKPDNLDLVRMIEVHQIPREDVVIFSAAVHGRADLMISQNHEFVRQAARAQDLFDCLTMQDFLAQHGT